MQLSKKLASAADIDPKFGFQRSARSVAAVSMLGLVILEGLN
jgi:hypothetical protein